MQPGAYLAKPYFFVWRGVSRPVQRINDGSHSGSQKPEKVFL
jgi:hypothetical protein